LLGVLVCYGGILKKWLASRMFTRLRRLKKSKLTEQLNPTQVTQQQPTNNFTYGDWLEVLGKDLFLLCVQRLDVSCVGIFAQVSKNWNEATKTNTLW
jgi:hypothetical protein